MQSFYINNKDVRSDNRVLNTTFGAHCSDGTSTSSLFVKKKNFNKFFLNIIHYKIYI